MNNTNLTTKSGKGKPIAKNKPARQKAASKKSSPPIKQPDPETVVISMKLYHEIETMYKLINLQEEILSRKEYAIERLTEEIKSKDLLEISSLSKKTDRQPGYAIFKASLDLANKIFDSHSSDTISIEGKSFQIRPSVHFASLINTLN